MTKQVTLAVVVAALSLASCSQDSAQPLPSTSAVPGSAGHRAGEFDYCCGTDFGSSDLLYGVNHNYFACSKHQSKAEWKV